MHYSSSVFRLLVLLGTGLVAAAFLPGCGREGVSSYRVPPDSTQEATDSSHGAHGSSAPEQAKVLPALKWKTPAGWEELTPGRMRVASFRVKGEGDAVGDVGVVPLPGMAGSDLDNVNRWRGQVGMEPVKEEELAGLGEDVEIAGTKGRLYDLAGTAQDAGGKMRILAAILRKDGVAWFFKMTGPDALVASQKGVFKEFLKETSFTEGTMSAMPGGQLSIEDMQLPASHPPIGGMTNLSGMAGLPPSHPPIDGMTNMGDLGRSHPSIEGMGAMGAAAAGPGAEKPSKPEWTVPAGWVETTAGAFLVARFQVKGEGASEATVNVSVSSGAGGGVAGNVNRWRGQLGLEVLPADQLQTTSMQASSGEAVVVDLTGSDTGSGKKLRLVGVVLPQGDRTWFYKLMGDEAVVGKEKEAFLGFVKEAKPK